MWAKQASPVFLTCTIPLPPGRLQPTSAIWDLSLYQIRCTSTQPAVWARCDSPTLSTTHLGSHKIYPNRILLLELPGYRSSFLQFAGFAIISAYRFQLALIPNNPLPVISLPYRVSGDPSQLIYSSGRNGFKTPNNRTQRVRFRSSGPIRSRNHSLYKGQRSSRPHRALLGPFWIGF